MESLKVIIPVLIIIAFYLLLRLIAKKQFSQAENFIKARIFTGAITAGFLLCLIIQSHNTREIITLSLLAILVFYGSLMLQKKYFGLKK